MSTDGNNHAEEAVAVPTISDSQEASTTAECNVSSDASYSDSEQEYRRGHAAFEDDEASCFILVPPEQQSMTIEERYDFFEQLELTLTSTCNVSQRLGNLIEHLIGGKQWLAQWVFKIPNGTETILFPCIIRVNQVADDLRAECTFVQPWDVSDDYFSPDARAQSREKEILARQFLEHHDLVLPQLSPVLYTKSIDNEAAQKHYIDLVEIATIIDHVRFWETVVYREWDESPGNEIIDINEPFDGELRNRLILYQQLCDGSMTDEQIQRYYMHLGEYNEISDHLEKLCQVRQPSEEVLDEIEQAKLQKIKSAKLLDFWETMEISGGTWSKASPLISRKMRASSKQLIHMVTNDRLFNMDMAAWATAGIGSGSDDESKQLEFEHHTSLQYAAHRVRHDDIVRIFAGEYEAPRRVEQNCIIQGLPWRVQRQSTGKYDVKKDEEEEDDEPPLCEPEHPDQAAYTKLGAIDADVDIVINGKMSVAAEYAIFEDLHFRLEDNESISIESGNVMMKNCTFFAVNLALIVHSGANLKLIDCCVVSMNELGIVQKLGATLEMVGCELLWPVMTETCQIYAPEMTNCSIDGELGLVEYRNMSKSDDKIMAYTIEEDGHDDRPNAQAEGDTSQQTVPESKKDLEAAGEKIEKISKAPEKVNANASLQNTVAEVA